MCKFLSCLHFFYGNDPFEYLLKTTGISLKHGGTNEQLSRYFLRGESRVSPRSVQDDTRFLQQKPGLTVDTV